MADPRRVVFDAGALLATPLDGRPPAASAGGVALLEWLHCGAVPLAAVAAGPDEAAALSALPEIQIHIQILAPGPDPAAAARSALAAPLWASAAAAAGHSAALVAPADVYGARRSALRAAAPSQPLSAQMRLAHACCSGTGKPPPNTGRNPCPESLTLNPKPPARSGGLPRLPHRRSAAGGRRRKRPSAGPASARQGGPP